MLKSKNVIPRLLGPPSKNLLSGRFYTSSKYDPEKTGAGNSTQGFSQPSARTLAGRARTLPYVVSGRGRIRSDITKLSKPFGRYKSNVRNSPAREPWYDEPYNTIRTIVRTILGFSGGGALIFFIGVRPPGTKRALCRCPKYESVLHGAVSPLLARIAVLPQLRPHHFRRQGTNIARNGAPGVVAVRFAVHGREGAHQHTFSFAL